MSLPYLYWKLFYALEKEGLDDKTVATKFRLDKNVASKFRLSQEDVYKARKEIERQRKIESKKSLNKIEYWFGKKPSKKALKTREK